MVPGQKHIHFNKIVKFLRISLLEVMKKAFQSNKITSSNVIKIKQSNKINFT